VTFNKEEESHIIAAHFYNAIDLVAGAYNDKGMVDSRHFVGIIWALLARQLIRDGMTPAELRVLLMEQADFVDQESTNPKRGDTR
tara:strand:- start:11529 stop:11783 length:255 start_codon:yes stop_codon:yes gene_type:complete